MQFDIITIFPKIFDSYLSETILKRAQEKKLIKIKIHNLRDYTTDKHKTVDDTPYGGGPGMVMKVEPIYKCLGALHVIPSEPKGRVEGSHKKTKIILLSPRGKLFDQKMARKFSKLDRLIFICGRYEGVDQRVADYLADEEVSIGNYVLGGGELAGLVIIEAVTRLLKGVLGNKESLKEETFSLPDIEYPQYTRPEVFKPKKRVAWKVPPILPSGNHKKIAVWRKKSHL